MPQTHPRRRRSAFALALAVALSLVSARAQQQAPPTTPTTTENPVLAWFAADPATRGAFRDLGDDLARDHVTQRRAELFAALRAGTNARKGRRLAEPAASAETATEHSLALGEMSMPYVLFHKGERPANGWPLFLCLHGGGGNAEATGPHAWDVNTGEWRTQRLLAARRYPSPGLYFVPRMADDRQGRWWFDHDQQAFDTVIRDAILFADVDPDRVYLLGISEGGYGAIRFAANRPDRFAACNGMAAAEPLSTSPPETMRNVALRIDIGERDTMFDRVGLARTMGERLAALRTADPAATCTKWSCSLAAATASTTARARAGSSTRCAQRDRTASSGPCCRSTRRWRCSAIGSRCRSDPPRCRCTCAQPCANSDSSWWPKSTIQDTPASACRPAAAACWSASTTAWSTSIANCRSSSTARRARQ